ncbi:MAG: RNA polymerase sigma factor [bacterium]|nr:RNA polymerase sigma factor [bacterium]
MTGELDLISASLQGDRRAFETLYTRHIGRVFALCLRMTGDKRRAESLTQDAFIRAWSKLATFQGRGEFGAWLRRLAVNVVIEDARRRKRERGAEIIPFVDQGLPTRGSETQLHEERIDLERAIADLPRGARHAFVLHDVTGLRHHEIGRLTGLATGTIKAQLHRARKLLRENLNRKGGSRDDT